MPFTSSIGATIEGFFDLYSGFAQEDSTRPLSWQLNPDGVVNLFGWCVWRDIDSFIADNVFRSMGGNGLTGSSACPPGIRDVSITYADGMVHMAARPDGKFYIRPNLLQNGAGITLRSGMWFSFDDVSWRNFGPV